MRRRALSYRLGRFLGVKVVGVLLAVGGVALALIGVMFLGGYGRAVVFIVGGSMTVYGVLLWTALHQGGNAGRPGHLLIGDSQQLLQCRRSYLSSALHHDVSAAVHAG